MSTIPSDSRAPARNRAPGRPDWFLHDDRAHERAHEAQQENAKSTTTVKLDLNTLKKAPPPSAPKEPGPLFKNSAADDQEAAVDVDKLKVTIRPGAGGRLIEAVLANTKTPLVGDPSGWEYLDPQGNVHGPFPANKMVKWMQQGYFQDGLQVRAKQGYWTTLALVKEDLLKAAEEALTAPNAKGPVAVTSSSAAPPSVGSAPPVVPPATAAPAPRAATDAPRVSVFDRLQQGAGAERADSRAVSSPAEVPTVPVKEMSLSEAAELLFTNHRSPVVEQPVWRYVDNVGSVQGPFNGSDMTSWHAADYLVPDLLVCGMQRKVSPPNLPSKAFYRPMQELLAFTKAGKRYAMVTLDDVKRGSPAPGWLDFGPKEQPRHAPRMEPTRGVEQQRPASTRAQLPQDPRVVQQQAQQQQPQRAGFLRGSDVRPGLRDEPFGAPPSTDRHAPQFGNDARALPARARPGGRSEAAAAGWGEAASMAPHGRHVELVHDSRASQQRGKHAAGADWEGLAGTFGTALAAGRSQAVRRAEVRDRPERGRDALPGRVGDSREQRDAAAVATGKAAARAAVRDPRDLQFGDEAAAAARAPRAPVDLSDRAGRQPRSIVAQAAAAAAAAATAAGEKAKSRTAAAAVERASRDSGRKAAEGRAEDKPRSRAEPEDRRPTAEKEDRARLKGDRKSSRPVPSESMAESAVAAAKLAADAVAAAVAKTPQGPQERKVAPRTKQAARGAASAASRELPGAGLGSGDAAAAAQELVDEEVDAVVDELVEHVSIQEEGVFDSLTPQPLDSYSVWGSSAAVSPTDSSAAAAAPAAVAALAEPLAASAAGRDGAERTVAGDAVGEEPVAGEEHAAAAAAATAAAAAAVGSLEGPADAVASQRGGLVAAAAAGGSDAAVETAIDDAVATAAAEDDTAAAAVVGRDVKVAAAGAGGSSMPAVAAGNDHGEGAASDGFVSAEDLPESFAGSDGDAASPRRLPATGTATPVEAPSPTRLVAADAAADGGDGTAAVLSSAADVPSNGDVLPAADYRSTPHIPAATPAVKLVLTVSEEGDAVTAELQQGSS